MLCRMDPVAVAIIAALFGGLGGAFVTGVLTWRVAIGQREFERQQAREARCQSRLERTYRDTLEHLFLMEAVINRTAPVISFEGEPGPPDFPDEAKMRALNAAVSVFGSKAVRDKLRRADEIPGVARTLGDSSGNRASRRACDRRRLRRPHLDALRLAACGVRQ